MKCLLTNQDIDEDYVKLKSKINTSHPIEHHLEDMLSRLLGTTNASSIFKAAVASSENNTDLIVSYVNKNDARGFTKVSPHFLVR